MFNFYDRMKPKCQKLFNHSIHWNNMFRLLLSRTEWDGLPDTIPEEFLKGFCIMNGTVGVGRAKDGNLYCFEGSYHGDINGYLPEKYQGALPNMQFDGLVDIDIAVGLNNATRTPDFDLWQYASILSEIDTSEKVNVLFSRFMRVPRAKDEKDRAAIVETITNIANGKIDAIVSNNIQADARALLSDGSLSEPFLDLTDVDKVDKLQYLNQYRENIVKRFFQHYGQKSSVGTKLAQMTEAETSVGDSIPLIGLFEWLHYQEKLSEDMNRIFGLSTSVKLGKAWADEVAEMHEMQAEENGEDTEDDTTTEGSEPDETENTDDGKSD